MQRVERRCDPHPWARLTADWDRLGFRYEGAVARIRHAEGLLAGTAGRAAVARHAATDVLTGAHVAAAELRAAPLLVAIEDLARRARLPLEMSRSREDDADECRATNALGLTPRELEVLALLGSGRSNGQIATHLFISTKTASVHVSNILRKLGVANRVEAGALARRRPPH